MHTRRDPDLCKADKPQSSAEPRAPVLVRAQYPLIKEDTLNYSCLNIMIEGICLN